MGESVECVWRPPWENGFHTGRERGGTPGFNGRRVPPDWRHTRHPRRIRLWTLWTLRRALVIGSNAAYWWSVIKKAAVVSKSTSKPAVRKVTVAKAPSKGGKKR